MWRVTDDVIVWASDTPVFAGFVNDGLLSGFSKCDLANIDRIGQNPHDLFQGPIGEPLGRNRRICLGNTLLIKVSRNVGVAHALIHKFIKNEANNAGFFFVDLQDFLFAAPSGVAEGGNAAVPPALLGRLCPAQHRLSQEVLTLHLSDCAENGNQDLAHLGTAVQAVLFAQKVDAILLKEGKSIQNILRIVVDKGNHWLCQWRKRAYSEGKSRQEKASKIK